MSCCVWFEGPASSDARIARTVPVQAGRSGETISANHRWCLTLRGMRGRRVRHAWNIATYRGRLTRYRGGVSIAAGSGLEIRHRESAALATSTLVASLSFHQHLHGLPDREAARLLPWRKLPERLQVLPHDRLRGNENK